MTKFSKMTSAMLVGAALLSTTMLTVPAAAQNATFWQTQRSKQLKNINNIIVIYLENRSFDNLFGGYPWANGIANAGASATQRDKSGVAYTWLPEPTGPFDVADNPASIRAIKIQGAPNRPFQIDGMAPGITTATYTRDLVHRFYTNRAQINGGANDRFAAWSDAAGLSMGYYSSGAMQNSNEWRLAQQNTLLDNFYQAAFGGSFLNHQWLICGCSPIWPNPPAAQRSILDSAGNPVNGNDNRVVAAGQGDYAINTVQSVFLNDGAQGTNLLPPQTQTTIGDTLTAKGVSWAWYSGGWNLAIKPNRTAAENDVLNNTVRFQWHHQAFAYYDRFNPNTAQGLSERTKFLKDADNLVPDIQNGTLPQVVFYKPAGFLNQHPGYANLPNGDNEVARIVREVQNSRYKDQYAIIITYDEFGGQWDHAAPPMGDAAGARADFWGPGTRIPAIVVSPFARSGSVDSTQYDTTSILKLIQDRFDLTPLASPRVNAADNMRNVFGF